MSMQLANMVRLSSGYTKFVNSIIGGSNKVYNTVDGMSTAIMNSNIASADNLTKGMKIADQYMDTYAKITLMNGGLEGAKELQDKMFASANRLSIPYEDMVSSITQMNNVASDTFSNKDEMIAFTELAQKSFKMGGASDSEQSAGMKQLTKAMSGGGIEKNQLSSIMDSAPKIAEAITTYTGKSREELKRMASEGIITSDTIKNAMLSMSSDINKDFKEMPKTFEDICTKMQNSALKAFGPVIVKINELINSDIFQGFINGLTEGIGVIADIALWVVEVIGWIGEKMMANWSIIQPILMAIGMVLLTLFAMTLINLASIAVAWIAAFWPVFLIIGIIGLLIYGILEFGEVFIEITGWIYGFGQALWGFVQNMLTAIYNLIAGVINAIGNLIDGISIFLTGCLNGAIQLINDLFGTKWETVSIPQTKKMKYEEYLNLGDEFELGKAIGKDNGSVTVDSFKVISDGLTGLFNKSDIDIQAGWKVPAFEEPPTLPTTPEIPKEMGITNAGGQPLDVAIDQDDIKYIQDLAERDYVAKFGTATLAPNISISFGDVHESMDINQVQGHVERILRQEIAMIGEG